MDHELRPIVREALELSPIDLMVRVKTAGEKIWRTTVKFTKGGMFARLSMRKITRKRFTRILMAYGIQPRDAREMAAYAEKNGVTYRKAYIEWLRTVWANREEERREAGKEETT